jgi:hypothetical protein
MKQRPRKRLRGFFFNNMGAPAKRHMLCPSERHCNSNSKNQNKLGKPLATLSALKKNW